MKKVLIALFLLTAVTTQAFAFLPEIVNVSKEEIKKYTDEELVMVYIDVAIERKARETFYSKSGFSTPKEYQSFKDLLMLTVRLRQEIYNRNIELPPINEWLK